MPGPSIYIGSDGNPYYSEGGEEPTNHKIRGTGLSENYDWNVVGIEMGDRYVLFTFTTDAPTITSPTHPSSTSQTVNPTASTVYLNGGAKAFEAYNIGGYNYFKLRDLAFVLNGTQKQFEVGYDNDTKAIALTSGESYTAVGGEMAACDGQSKTATPTPSKIYLDGKELNLTVYNIGGNNFFKLRDLMEAVDVYVGYDDNTKAITLDTSKGYVPV